MRRLAALAFLAACALVAPAAAVAAPDNRDDALEQYRAVVQDEQVDAGWTGSVDGCNVGEESQASLTATLDTVNTLRSFAGVGAVTFDPTLNHRALSAALMMKAAGELSHTPGPDWPCYSFEGDAGAGQSNLFLGASGATAMVGYVDDSGIESLGHRRWLLDPGRRSVRLRFHGDHERACRDRRPVDAGATVHPRFVAARRLGAVAVDLRNLVGRPRR